MNERKFQIFIAQKRKEVHKILFLQNVCFNKYLLPEYHFLPFEWWAMVKN